MDVDSSSLSSEEEIKKQKKSKKSKKHKSKDKKQKKHKKHRRRSSSSDSKESSGEEDAWVEAGTTKKLETKGKKCEDLLLADCPEPSTSRVLPIKPRTDDDDWANFGSMIPTYSNDAKKLDRRKEKAEERQKNLMDKPGQHGLELNPFWKDGGIGLPEETDQPEKQKPQMTAAVGDGGLAWLKKSFQRAKEQAKDEGRSLEDVVSERWGSLEAFYSLLEEAESKAKGSDNSQREKTRDRDRDGREYKSSRSFKRPSRDSGSDEDYDRHRSRSSHHSSSRRERDSNRDRNPSWMKHGAKTRPPPSPSYNDRDRSRDPLLVSKAPSTSGSARLESDTSSKRAIEKNVEDMEIADVPEPEEEEPTPNVLSDKEMNELNAKIFKAEMLGNDDLLKILKDKLQEAEAARQEFIKNGGTPGESKKATRIVTKIIVGSQNNNRRKKDKPTETHKNGERVRYFPDDDKQSLKSMFEKERLNTVEDENALFCRLAAKGAKASGDYDADEIFVDKASSSRQGTKEQEREVKKALDEEKVYRKVIDDCLWCFDGKHLEKNLVVSMGQNSFLCVPPHQSLTEGHCLIVPMFHASCSTELDEDVWEEMQKFRKALVRMFREADQDVVFFETAVSLKRQPHMYLECVSMPKETGDLAPIYFKKAIQECEMEWAQNKKVVELRDRNVRRAIPKGLPYFSVEFADDNCGFAHVIEDERNFPQNFAQEIIGGMLELDHQVWRKQKRDDFQTQRKKLMTFLKLWAPYDWTREEST